MDEQTTGSRSSLPSAVPWPVWLLLAAAMVQLIVQVAPDSYSVFGPYFLVDAGMVLDWVHSVSLFLLAAAVVVGADRWPAGRRRLRIGAGALGIVALLRLGLDIWWMAWEASGHAYPVNPPWVLGMYVAAGALFVVANVMLAGGLWTSRAHGSTSRTRAVLLAAIGVAGLVATGVGLWVVAQSLTLAPPDSRAYITATSTLGAAGLASLALLALVAVRSTPISGGLPEILIAAGAVITLAASAWNRGVLYSIPLQDVPEEAFFWAFTLPFIAEAVGVLMLIGGFGLAAIAVHRARTADGRGA